jgi:enoyl-CoA hydratase
VNGISSEHDVAVLRIRLDRPEKLNAVDTPMLDELPALLDGAAADDSVRAVQLTGAGRAFCSGGDLTDGDTAPLAYFQLAFSRVGLMPDGGACALLPGLIGRARAARMAFTSERIDATTAFDWGKISHVTAEDDYDTVLEDVLRSVSGGPTVSFSWTKRAQAAATLGELDADGQLALIDTADFREGVRAFRERRTPNFHGH